eukprot:6196839-Pleurochrysis_carterae.AAC.1
MAVQAAYPISRCMSSDSSNLSCSCSAPHCRARLLLSAQHVFVGRHEYSLGLERQSFHTTKSITSGLGRNKLSTFGETILNGQ